MGAIFWMVLAVVLVYVITLYNSLVTVKNAVSKAWANIDVLLKQRHDELPKLVDPCKQYMQYEQVLTVLEKTGARANRLKLELTETVLIANVEDVIAKMLLLKAQGVGFSLDDFGTGYSSLSYLKRLPLDQLKTDRSFVRDILIDPNDASIAQMILALANSLGLTVIAEGVETEAQRGYLASIGCHN